MGRLLLYEVKTMKEKILFTSESISEGHPDKVCDQIADTVLDECLKNDSNSRVACEVFASDNYIVVGGEITCKSKINYESIVKSVLKKIGYDKTELGTDYHDVQVNIKVKEQSPDISMVSLKRKTKKLEQAIKALCLAMPLTKLKVICL